MKDDFKEITGYSGAYLINSEGVIKSCERYVNGRVLGKKRIQRGGILKQHTEKTGYVTCELRGYVGSDKPTKRVHRMVAVAFIPNPEGKTQVNHKNGIKHDNRLCNLEWATPSENTQHAHTNGFTNILKGSKSPLSKLTEWDVHFIRLWVEVGYKHSTISKYFDCKRGNISDIIRRKSWAHLETKW